MRTGKVLLATFLMLLPALFGEIILLNDNLNDGDRLNQDLPNSALWIHSSSNDSIIWIEEVEPGNWATIMNQEGTTVRAINAYFTPEGEPVSITAENNILRYSFDVTPDSNPSWSSIGFRVALLNTGETGVRYTTDVHAGTGGGYPIESGYALFINPRTGRTQFQIRSTADHWPLSSTVPYTGIANLDPDNDPSLGYLQMTGGTTYRVTMELELLLTGDVKITARIFDGEETYTYSHIDETYKLTEFDTIMVAQREFNGPTIYDNHKVYFVAESLSYDHWAADQGLIGPDADPGLDFDGDGFTNREEFIADTNPTDPDSFFSTGAVMREESLSIVSFQSSSNRVYELWFTPNLTGEAGWERVQGPRSGTGEEDSMTHELQDESASGFYRIRVSLP